MLYKHTHKYTSNIFTLMPSGKRGGGGGGVREEIPRLRNVWFPLYILLSTRELFCYLQC